MQPNERPITMDELTKLGNYLAQRPWLEVNPLIVLLEQVAGRVTVAALAETAPADAKEP